MTKQLLWEEYTAFKTAPSEKLFIDFSGDGIDVIDPKTGEVSKAVLFVATLGASSYTYVEPVLRQDLPTWTQ